MARYDDFETRAVMDRTNCDFETAVRTLDWSGGRIGVAIDRLLTEQKYGGTTSAQ